MVQPNVALRLLATACLLAGVVFAGGAMAKPGDAAPAAKLATASVVQASAVSAPAPSTVSTAVAIAEPAAPACARKVKVVYAGYGEADRAACSTAKVAAD